MIVHTIPVNDVVEHERQQRLARPAPQPRRPGVAGVTPPATFLRRCLLLSAALVATGVATWPRGYRPGVTAHH